MISKSLDVLLVEDDEVDVMQVSRAFKKKGFTHRLHFASDGIEALNLMRPVKGNKTFLPHIILLDLHMPRMGGLEFLRELRQDPHLQHISVFIMTTSADDRDKDEAYHLNAAGYIVKPVSVDKFNTAIEKLNGFLTLNDREILNDAGSISHELGKEIAEKEYIKFKENNQNEIKDGDFERVINKIQKKKRK